MMMNPIFRFAALTAIAQGVTWIPFCVVVGVLASIPAAAAEESKLPPAASERVDFQRDIQPIFAERCFSCHSADKHEGGLRLDRKADALAGGDSGPVLQPGKSSASLLVRYVAGIEAESVMPPEGDRLTGKL